MYGWWNQINNGRVKFSFKKEMDNICIDWFTFRKQTFSGLVNKTVIQEKPKITEYSLTEKGKLSKNFFKEYYGYIASIASNSSNEEEILKQIQKL